MVKIEKHSGSTLINRDDTVIKINVVRVYDSLSHCIITKVYKEGELLLELNFKVEDVDSQP